MVALGGNLRRLLGVGLTVGLGAFAAGGGTVKTVSNGRDFMSVWTGTATCTAWEAP